MSGVDSCLYRCLDRGNTEDYCEYSCFKDGWEYRKLLVAFAGLAALALIGSRFFHSQKVQLQSQGEILSAKKFERYENYAHTISFISISIAAVGLLGNILVYFFEKDINQSLRNRY